MISVQEAHEERKARREAEINGVKDALEVLIEFDFVHVSAKHLHGVRNTLNCTVQQMILGNSKVPAEQKVNRFHGLCI